MMTDFEDFQREFPPTPRAIIACASVKALTAANPLGDFEALNAVRPKLASEPVVKAFFHSFNEVVQKKPDLESAIVPEATKRYWVGLINSYRICEKIKNEICNIIRELNTTGYTVIQSLGHGQYDMVDRVFATYPSQLGRLEVQLGLLEEHATALLQTQVGADYVSSLFELERSVHDAQMAIYEKSRTLLIRSFDDRMPLREALSNQRVAEQQAQSLSKILTGMKLVEGSMNRLYSQHAAFADSKDHQQLALQQNALSIYQQHWSSMTACSSAQLKQIDDLKQSLQTNISSALVHIHNAASSVGADTSNKKSENNEVSIGNKETTLSVKNATTSESTVDYTSKAEALKRPVEALSKAIDGTAAVIANEQAALTDRMKVQHDQALARMSLILQHADRKELAVTEMKANLLESQKVFALETKQIEHSINEKIAEWKGKAATYQLAAQEESKKLEALENNDRDIQGLLKAQLDVLKEKRKLGEFLLPTIERVFGVRVLDLAPLLSQFLTARHQFCSKVQESNDSLMGMKQIYASFHQVQCNYIPPRNLRNVSDEERQAISTHISLLISTYKPMDSMLRQLEF